MKKETICLNHFIFQHPVSSLSRGSEGQKTMMRQLWVIPRAGIVGGNQKKTKSELFIKKGLVNYAQLVHIYKTHQSLLLFKTRILNLRATSQVLCNIYLKGGFLSNWEHLGHLKPAATNWGLVIIVVATWMATTKNGASRKGNRLERKFNWSRYQNELSLFPSLPWSPKAAKPCFSPSCASLLPNLGSEEAETTWQHWVSHYFQYNLREQKTWVYYQLQGLLQIKSLLEGLTGTDWPIGW